MSPGQTQMGREVEGEGGGIFAKTETKNCAGQTLTLTQNPCYLIGVEGSKQIPFGFEKPTGG